MSYVPTANSDSATYGLIQGAKRSLDLEIPLFETRSEREKGDSIAELYSIIVAVNALEKSYIKDEFGANEEYYTNTSVRLIRQFYLLLESDEVKQEYGDLDSFVKRFGLNCPLGVKRIKIRFPATIEEATKELTRRESRKREEEQQDRPTVDQEEDKLEEDKIETPMSSMNDKGRAIAEATGAFITLMDAIKLNYNTKEQLHPLLSDIVTSTNKVFPEYEGRARLVEWLIKLNGMRLDETLSEDELKEFLWDVDSAYKGFFSKLG